MDKNTVFSNLIWRFAERIGAQLVSFIVSIVIARVIDPDTYGIVALIVVFTAILQVFVDSGLGNALIQKKDADNLDFSTVFYTNIVFCTLLYFILFFCAPLISWFYENSELTPYVRVLGVTILISGVKNVQQAYVSRHMLFKKFFFSTLAGTIIAGIVGITMAYNGEGVWALVAQQLVNLSIDTLVLWITVKWRPSLSFSFGRLKALFSFGWKLLISNLISTIYEELRQLLIGKKYSSADLAYYNQGNKMPDLVVRNVNASIDSVLLPAMSNEQDDKNRVKAMTRKSIKVSVYVMAPLMMGLAFLAEPVIRVLLTEKWLPCVFYLRIFCLTLMFFPIHTANLNAIKALGRSDVYLKLEIIKKIMGLTILFISIQISVKAIAYSLLISELLSQIINTFPNKKLLNYSYWDQIKDIIPSVILAITMGLIIYPFFFLHINVFIQLVLQVFTGMLVYWLGSIFFKLDTYMYLKGIIIAYIRNRKLVR